MKYFSRNAAFGSERVLMIPRRMTILLCAALAACAPQEVVRSTAPEAPATVAVAQPAPPPPVVALPYGDAVKLAARDLFTKAKLPDGQSFNLVIDPLVDGTTGMQSVATVAME